MALRKSISVSVPYVGELTLPAYIKVANVNGYAQSITATVQVFHDSATRELIRNEQHSIAPDLESPDNFIRQAYLHLKSLPEFAGATDC